MRAETGQLHRFSGDNGILVRVAVGAACTKTVEGVCSTHGEQGKEAASRQEI